MSGPAVKSSVRVTGSGAGAGSAPSWLMRIVRGESAPGAVIVMVPSSRVAVSGFASVALMRSVASPVPACGSSAKPPPESVALQRAVVVRPTVASAPDSAPSVTASAVTSSVTSEPLWSLSFFSSQAVAATSIAAASSPAGRRSSCVSRMVACF